MNLNQHNQIYILILILFLFKINFIIYIKINPFMIQNIYFFLLLPKLPVKYVHVIAILDVKILQWKGIFPNIFNRAFFKMFLNIYILICNFKSNCSVSMNLMFMISMYSIINYFEQVIKCEFILEVKIVVCWLLSFNDDG